MRKRVAYGRLLAAAGLLALLAGAAACEDHSHGACACAGDQEQAPPVDAPLMAFLSKARAAHHQADLREEGGDVPGALRALEQVVSTPLPGGAHPRPEALEVLADTLARLADLRGQQGDYDAAERDIAKGLQTAPARSYFEGHLWEIRGVNEERRAKALAAAGDREQAEQARRRGMDAFERAVTIQDQVIRDTLTEDAGK